MISLKPAASTDWARLWYWRNDPVTREMFLEPDVVGLKAHLEWLSRTLKDRNVQLYVAHDGSRGACVGTCRIDILAGDKKDKTKRLTVSLTIDPRWRGQGYAEQILTTLIEHWDFKRGDTMTAMVKEANIASLRAFVTAGFGYKDVTDGLVRLEYLGVR